MQPVSPKYEKHVDDHLNISSVLAFSEQQDALIAAQQQVTQRVMDNNQLLRDALRQEHERAEQLQRLLEKEQAKNAELQARVDHLESRPINVTGDYVETQRINKYFAARRTTKRTSLRKPSNDLTLPLWDNNAISL